MCASAREGGSWPAPRLARDLVFFRAAIAQRKPKRKPNAQANLQMAFSCGRLNNAHVQATCPRTCLKHGYILPCQLVTEARRQMALEAAARYEHAHEGAESDEATEALEEAAA